MENISPIFALAPYAIAVDSVSGQIVTDGGAQSDGQMEALRVRPRLPKGDKVQ